MEAFFFPEQVLEEKSLPMSSCINTIWNNVPWNNQPTFYILHSDSLFLDGGGTSICNASALEKCKWYSGIRVVSPLTGKDLLQE